VISHECFCNSSPNPERMIRSNRFFLVNQKRKARPQ